MEGPSLVIAGEELKRFKNRSIANAMGTAKIPFQMITHSRLIGIHTWGKHFILEFKNITIRIHFLMFGSYRINNPRANRIPKLQLVYKDDVINFYSCAIKVLPNNYKEEYDWSIDLMSPKWNAAQAYTSLTLHPHSEICDLLLDQKIFSGLGNIMKNEILFKVKLLPQVKVKDLSANKLKTLIKEAERYAWQFYEWKKANVLKRNWKIMRKKICSVCGGKVMKKPTGKLLRISHYCKHCQHRK